MAKPSRTNIGADCRKETPKSLAALGMLDVRSRVPVVLFSNDDHVVNIVMSIVAGITIASSNEVLEHCSRSRELHYMLEGSKSGTGCAVERWG